MFITRPIKYGVGTMKLVLKPSSNVFSLFHWFVLFFFSTKLICLFFFSLFILSLKRVWKRKEKKRKNKKEKRKNKK